MAQSWEALDTIRQCSGSATWSNESEEDSSEYDSSMPNQAHEIDLDEMEEFPREDLQQVIDGLNKWPWTVYPSQLQNCLHAAAKIVAAGNEGRTPERRRLVTLFAETVPSSFEKCLDDKAIWKWSDEIHSHIFSALLRLTDLVVLKAPQLIIDDSDLDSPGDDVLQLLRMFALGVDKQSQYHIKHKDQPLIPSLSALDPPNRFATPVAGSPVKNKNGEWFCATRKTQVREIDGCSCQRCQLPDCYCWLSYLLNYFGQTPYGNGYQVLVKILQQPDRLLPAVVEAVLQPLSRSVDFLTDEAAALFLQPCKGILQFVAERLEGDVDSLSDKTRDGSFGALSLILKHLQLIVSRCLSIEEAERMVSAVQRRMVERMLGFSSFNKQLSAVREINKLLEMARQVAPRDNSQSVHTTIQWLEKNDILRNVLRSHLHHKQYVDQVEKIMRFLLQERQLSEEHLDAIWAATEKPDQFEAVKNNIFDLLADLAWSFSDEQLDSLFGRFERSQGRTPADTSKILQLVKKLARSDTKGVMATRLLEILWNLMHSGEAPAEVLESGALTEILGHYDSVKCASKGVYIERCLKMIEGCQSVIPSLRLLREIIMLDSEKPFYQDQRSTTDIPRSTRVKNLENEHKLLDMVVGSLESYMKLVRTLPATIFVAGGQKGRAPTIDGGYTHEEHVQERLNFLIWACQVGAIYISWEASERIWRELVELPACQADQERGLQWFCAALDRWPALDETAQANILSQKLTKMDPVTLPSIAWRCFQRLFLWVNLNKKKLKQPRNDESTMTVDLDLEGLPYLWQIALHSSSNEIVSQCINFLKDIHTCLADNLQADVVPIRQTFVDECMRRLTTAIEGGAFKGEGTDSCSMAESGGEPDEKRASLSSDAGADMQTVDQAGQNQGTRTNPKVTLVADNHQVERCLRLLMVFITKCEGRCPRKVPAHGASFQGRPVRLEVSTAMKQSTRFGISVHANEYLASLRAKVGRRLDCSPARVRLVYQGRELLQDWQVVRQCGLQDGHTITAQVNHTDRATEIVDEQRLPGILISHQKQVYETLFKLLEMNNSSTREAADNLLMLLPTHPDILADFLSLLDAKTNETAQAILRRQFTAQSRLLYTLQVLDGILMPVNWRSMAKTRAFRAAFVRYGGFKCLVDVFQPGALPESVDDRTRRGCYASALRLVKFLLLGGDSEIDEVEEAQSPTATPIIRANVSVVMENSKDDEEDDDVEDVVVSMSESTNGSIEPETTVASTIQKMPDVTELVDMSQVVEALTNLAWSTAIGQVAAMGNPVPMTAGAVVITELEESKVKSRHIQIDDDEEDSLNQDDLYLCQEAFMLLGLCLRKQRSLLRPFFTSPLAAQFIVDSVLHSPEHGIRYKAAELFFKLSRECSGPDANEGIVHKCTLMALLATKPIVHKQPRQCAIYWELLSYLMKDIPHTVADRAMARQQLGEEIKWLLTCPPTVNEHDRTMDGRLLYIKTLVEVLDCSIIGSSRARGGEGLVELIIKEMLFPEWAISSGLSASKEGSLVPGGIKFGVLKGSLEEEGLLQAKCGTDRSRQAAFQLLLTLTQTNLENMRETVALLMRIHFQEDCTTDWEYLPSYGRKAVGSYVGLKNAGATCYMNSVFQQLYMQPQVRKSVLSCDECGDLDKQDSVFFQVQAMFGALLGSSLDHYIPNGFWNAYRDYDGLPINLREHQDAFEFFNRLYDSVDETLKAIHHKPTLTNIFGGVFAQQVICRGCPHRSEREEPYAAISVDVKNKRDLPESLDSFVRGDLLEADNAYYCEECGKKVDALKRVCVKTLPRTLVIHLKRFDFDYETMQRLKLKERFEFPIQLDMKPYTVEGLALKERLQASSPKLQAASLLSSYETPASSYGETKNDAPIMEGLQDRGEVTASTQTESAAEGTSAQTAVEGSFIPPPEEESIEALLGIPVRPESYYRYNLVGVVVHSGTAFAGHYYSYIKERKGDRPLDSSDEHSGDRWIAFDDKRVEPYELGDLEKDCFGGKYTVDVYDNFLKTTAPQEFDRPNSAYMLFYERVPGDQVDPLDGDPASASQSVTKQEGDVPMQETSSVKEQVLHIPPSIHRAVWEDNLKFVHENHMLDRDYFAFLCKLLEGASAVCNKYQQQQQFQMLDEERGTKLARTILPLSDKELAELVRLAMELATELLCRVYLRTHSSLREDMSKWKVTMAKLLESNMMACKFFHQKLISHPQWLLHFLIRCPIEDVRQMFALFLDISLTSSVNFLNGKSMHVDPHTGRPQDILGVNAIVDHLLALLSDAMHASAHPAQYFYVIRGYANLGTMQRSHLINKNAILLLADYCTMVGLHLSQKLDLGAILSTLSVLLRSCDVSAFYDVPELEADIAGEEGVDQDFLPLPNPYAAEGYPVMRLSQDTLDCVRNSRFIELVVEMSPDSEDSIKLLEFLSWHSEVFSGALCKEVMLSIQKAVASEVRFLLGLLLRILQIPDALQAERQEATLLGMDLKPCLMDLILSNRQMSVPKRYILIKFAAKMAISYPSIGRLLLQHHGIHWRKAVDWLAEELVSNGSPSHLTNPATSNEDAPSGYLQRTSSAEFTLQTARSVFSLAP